MKYCRESEMDYLKTLAERERELPGMEFISPIVKGGRVRAKSGNLVWEVRPEQEWSGWGAFRITAGKKAKLIREAEIWEKDEYAKQHPLKTLIMTGTDSSGITLGYDFYEKTIHPVLLAPAVSIFDAIICCCDGGNFWYLSVEGSFFKHNRDSIKRMIESDNPGSLSIDGLNARRMEIIETALSLKELQNNNEKSTTRYIAEKALELSGATLKNLSEIPEGFIIQWEKNNQTYESITDKKLSVISAGFCLSGMDKQQDLITLASLADHRPEYYNPDLHYIPY